MKFKFIIWGITFEYSLEEFPSVCFIIAIGVIGISYFCTAYSIAAIPYEMKKLETCQHVQR